MLCLKGEILEKENWLLSPIPRQSFHINHKTLGWCCYWQQLQMSLKRLKEVKRKINWLCQIFSKKGLIFSIKPISYDLITYFDSTFTSKPLWSFFSRDFTPQLNNTITVNWCYSIAGTQVSKAIEFICSTGILYSHCVWSLFETVPPHSSVLSVP